jgi:hypothetical protein
MTGKLHDDNQFRRQIADRVMHDSQVPVRVAMARRGDERGAQATGAKSVEPTRRFSKATVAHLFQFFFVCIMHWRSGMVMKRGRVEGSWFQVQGSRWREESGKLRAANREGPSGFRLSAFRFRITGGLVYVLSLSA